MSNAAVGSHQLWVPVLLLFCTHYAQHAVAFLWTCTPCSTHTCTFSLPSALLRPTNPTITPPSSPTPQVDAASNQLANHLISSCGVCEGDVVGLMVQRSHNMMIAMLAILKAGGAYLPLDPGHPPSRTAFIVEDAGLKVRTGGGSGDVVGKAQLKCLDTKPGGSCVPSQAAVRSGSSAHTAGIDHTCPHLPAHTSSHHLTPTLRLAPICLLPR